ncbi:hypothetical protein AOQ84DRAFT_388572, partial [Glonium stellatum]
MTSRPAPGIQDSLQRAGSGGPQRPQNRRRPSAQLNPASNARPDVIDLTLDSEKRSAEDASQKTRPSAATQGVAKPKPGPLENIQTSQNEQARPPPRGKPQLFFNGGTNNAAENSGMPPHLAHGHPVQSPINNVPMPPRPGSTLHDEMLQQHRRITPGGSGVKKDTTSKFAGFDPPSAAILFPHGKTADFFPWNGNHPEDILSDTLVKSGVSNKPQMLNEGNTARPSLWSNLKNKSGLQTLSTLFVAVLEKRQSCGRLTAPSTFKPPPRVTLTDTKREGWLRDLANPAIALRRLSRTIPHGIRGKLLLEQCLSKNIPTARAVWLAKCVGSNEMRAFKRKGANGTVGIGGELKWIREWTVFVEQFVESTISACGQQDWKPRMDYAIRLSSHLYSDHLLDQDHYLDWLLTSLDASSLERLPIWLLLVQIYWQDLIASRRRGRRLAEGLLTHANSLNSDGDDDTNKAIFTHLEKLITNLVISRPACLLLPKTWDSQKEVLQVLARKQPNSEFDKAVRNIDRRNRRLADASQKSGPTVKSPKKEVVALLDSLEHNTNINIEKVSTDCTRLLPDAQELISTVLQWGSSIYREGVHRIYLVTRLIRKWNSMGIDTDSGILSFLTPAQPNKSTEPQNVFRIVAELTRSKHFSVGRYLQWLIATGSLNRNNDFSQNADCHFRLIAELPLNDLSDHVLNLRHTLLQSVGFPIESEEKMLDDAQDFVIHQIPTLFESSEMVAEAPEVALSELSTTIKLDLGRWMRQQVASKTEIVEPAPIKGQPIEPPSPVSTITPSQFYMVREIIEQLGDYSILADILGVVTSSSDYAVLSGAADTLNYHVKTFAAIGAFKPLFQRLGGRYATLRIQRPPEREHSLALADLVRTAGADIQLMQLLAFDLSRCEQKASLAACSPASDNMTDILQSTKMDTDDEIDRILASGTSMDEQIMSRVFNKITTRLEEQLGNPLATASTFGSWFYRLRNFDDKAFEKLVNQWISKLLFNHAGKVLMTALPTLTAASCITLSSFMDVSNRCVSSLEGKDGISAARVSLETLNAVLPNDELNRFCQTQDAYRYRLEQQKFCADPEKGILRYIRRTIDLCSLYASTDLDNHLTSLLSSNRLLALLRQFAVHDVQTFATTSGIGSDSTTGIAAVKRALDRLLDPANSLDLPKKSLEDQVSTIVNAADDLSLPFCQLELRQIFELNKSSSDGSDDTVSVALLEAIKAAVDNDRSNWSDLIGGLDSGLTRKIREHAEAEIFNAIASLGKIISSPPKTSERLDESFIRRYLTVVDFTASNVSSEGQSQITTVLVDRLKALVELLSAPNEKASDLDSMLIDLSASSPTTAELCPWLHALLHLAIIHKPTFQTGKSSTQAQAAFLWLLRCLFTNPALQRHPTTAEHVFDAAAYFSDDLPDDLRTHLAKLDAARPIPDPRAAFVFG